MHSNHQSAPSASDCSFCEFVGSEFYSSHRTGIQWTVVRVAQISWFSANSKMWVYAL
ncbi:MAG: hypothetical protein AAF363_14760 [Bacteroidota bacterium]